VATEFRSFPRTPPTPTQSESPQHRIELREVHYSLSTCDKSVKASSPPSRKKSRFFDTLLLKSPWKEGNADENGTPKSLRKRKSIVDFLSFSSARYRKAPHDSDVDPGSRIKWAGATSPPKTNALRTFTTLDAYNQILTSFRECLTISHESTEEPGRYLGLDL
jgi:hypothetical protein